MKYLISGIFILFSFSCYAHELAVVDIDFLFKNSKSGKSIQKKFENIDKDIVSDFKKKEKTFKQQEQDLISKKNVLSEDEFLKYTNTQNASPQHLISTKEHSFPPASRKHDGMKTAKDG